MAGDQEEFPGPETTRLPAQDGNLKPPQRLSCHHIKISINLNAPPNETVI